MSIRPFRDIKRRKTKKIKVGKVEVGGDAPISVQSMTNTLTTDVKKTIDQINDLAEAGADIVTLPPSIFEEMYKHDLTDQGIKQFDKDWKKLNS